jgi:hypothetical protein
VPAVRVILSATSGGCASAVDVCHNVISLWGGLKLTLTLSLISNPRQTWMRNPGNMLTAFLCCAMS